MTAWDLPTRLFHWSLVALVAAAWISYRYAEALGDVTLVWHRGIGLAILTLVVWRVLWGFAGSATSRFATFVRSPAAALAYARDLIAGKSRHFLGHNPLGAWMILALLCVLATDAGFGLFAVDDNDLTGGPLYRLVSEDANKFATHWHEEIFDAVLLPLIALHIAANVFYGRVKKEPLITAMVTGMKPAGAYEDAQCIGAAGRPMLRAALLLVLAAAIVLGAIFGLGGKF